MSNELWRVGTHYGIHIYAGDVPVATALTTEAAARIVADHNEIDRLRTQVAKLNEEGDDLIGEVARLQRLVIDLTPNGHRASPVVKFDFTTGTVTPPGPITL